MNNSLIIVLGALAVALALGALFYLNAAHEDLGDLSDQSEVTENMNGLITGEETSEEIAESAAESIPETQAETAATGETAIIPSEEENVPAEVGSQANPIVVVETNMGTWKMELYLDLTPITSGNFIKLAEQQYYDGLVFHRIIVGFMVQGGDPNCVSGEGSCGGGGPGWSIPLEIVPELRHSEAGMVAMARSSDPDSAGSQFYITLGPQDFLDDGYAVFGKVIEGLDVVMAIGSVETNSSDRPLEDVVMMRVYIEE